jgi:hypothetical protein
LILLGCLLAFSAAIAPRLVLILAWIFSDRWPLVWQGDWVIPLLGIIFLPYTTIMYMLSVVVLPGGETTVEGFGWIWIILGIFLDIMKWGQMLANRREAQARVMTYYPSGAPRVPTGTGMSEAEIASGQVPPSTSPTSPDSDTAPTASTTPPDDTKGSSSGSG